MITNETSLSTAELVRSNTLSLPNNSKIKKNIIINSSNKTNLHEKGNLINAIDIFNESVGDGCYYHQESGMNENQKRTGTIVDDIHNYRKYITQFNLIHKPDLTSSILFWQT